MSDLGAAREGKAPPLLWPALPPLRPLRFRGTKRCFTNATDSFCQEFAGETTVVPLHGSCLRHILVRCHGLPRCGAEALNFACINSDAPLDAYHASSLFVLVLLPHLSAEGVLCLCLAASQASVGNILSCLLAALLALSFVIMVSPSHLFAEGVLRQGPLA